MTASHGSVQSEPARPRVSVSVLVEYQIDPRGTAKVRDIKTLKNDGSAPAVLTGFFKQAVNHNVSQLRVSDSRSPEKKYPFQIVRGDDHHQVAVEIEAPEGSAFVIEPGTERSLIFEYEMSGSTTALTGGAEPAFLINNRFGSVTYQYEFATIEYNIKYQISKLTPSRWWQTAFLRPSLLRYPSDLTVREDRNNFYVEYKFSCDAKSVKYVHMEVLYQPKYWAQWMAAFASGVASSVAVATAPSWLGFLASIF